ncbi:hypothetical protein PANA5342_2834 [Pantoea ananatis LMG 5342]|nr:hypothetical protein PANA5342_2834 [Pantoea ananatis LMG 5342]
MHDFINMAHWFHVRLFRYGVMSRSYKLRRLTLQ